MMLFLKCSIVQYLPKTYFLSPLHIPILLERINLHAIVLTPTQLEICLYTYKYKMPLKIILNNYIFTLMLFSRAMVAISNVCWTNLVHNSMFLILFVYQ